MSQTCLNLLRINSLQLRGFSVPVYPFTIWVWTLKLDWTHRSANLLISKYQSLSGHHIYCIWYTTCTDKTDHNPTLTIPWVVLLYMVLSCPRSGMVRGCQGENWGPHPPMSSSSGMGCSMLHIGFTAWYQRGLTGWAETRRWTAASSWAVCETTRVAWVLQFFTTYGHHNQQKSPFMTILIFTIKPSSSYWMSMNHHENITNHHSSPINIKKNTIKSPSSHHEGTIKSPLNITNHHCTKQNHGVPGLAVLCSRRCNCSTRATAAPCVPKHGHGIFPQESWT